MGLKNIIRGSIKKSRTVRRRIAFSYFSVILVGTILFATGLPMKNLEKINIIDALFTATSAFADSGLNTISNDNFNIFGHILTLILLELGGIGIMAFKFLFLIFLGQKINVYDRLFIQTEQSQDKISGLIQLMKISTIIFLVTQFVLAMIFSLDLFFRYDFSSKASFGYGIYYAVSTVTSAGYDIIPGTFAIFREDYLWLTVVMIGLFIGGIGFPTLVEMYQAHQAKKNKKIFHHTLYFKINMWCYFIVLFLGLVAVFVSEHNDFLTKVSGVDGFFTVLFQVFSIRSAGFMTTDLHTFNTASRAVFTVLMFIGVGPASTGGGIRTTTLAIIVLSFAATMRGKDDVNVFNRKISNKSISAAFMVMSFATILTIFATISILFQSENITFFDAFFESISAFGTIGESMGITHQLNGFNKVVISIVMIVGRLGIIGTMLMFTSKNHDDSIIKYPQENVSVG